MLISYSILCLHIICVIRVTHIKLYSQTVSFSIRSHAPYVPCPLNYFISLFMNMCLTLFKLFKLYYLSNYHVSNE